MEIEAAGVRRRPSNLLADIINPTYLNAKINFYILRTRQLKNNGSVGLDECDV